MLFLLLLKTPVDKMTLTPLHIAFVWVLKPLYRGMRFAPATVAAILPDIEIIFFWIFQGASFCGINLICESIPDRLILHSILGSLTVGVLLTAIMVKIIGKYVRPHRFGIYGFSAVPINRNFVISAAFGGMSHVLIDWLHHPENPIFWPISNQPYIDGLLIENFGVFHSSLLTAAISGLVMILIIKEILNKSGHSLFLIVSNPILSLTIITKALDN